VEEHLVSLLAPTSFEAEQYRALRYVVEQMHKSSGLSILAVTSAAAGDGKTTTAINLAGALAQAPDGRVLLVEADVRRPSVTLGDRLGSGNSGGPGLVDAVLDQGIGLESVVQRHPRFNLSVLPAGWRPTAPYEVLKSPRLGELMEEARQQYDYVIVDTPPLLVVPDSRVIGKWVDGFLVVVAAGETPRKLLAEALTVMEPAKVVGLVFNGDHRPLSGYYGYYYAYGQFPARGSAGWWDRVVGRLGGSLWRRGSPRQGQAR
jgi:capsular exopolysaccharide synthesis family protein